jgi:DNA/RNA endonuclease G (NUC1)
MLKNNKKVWNEIEKIILSQLRKYCKSQAIIYGTYIDTKF